MKAETLALYLGCNVMVNDPNEPHPVQMVAINMESIFIDSGCDYPHGDVKLILRQLSSMNQDEKKEYELTLRRIKLDGLVWIWTADTFKYLLSKHFDLFGLIESGEAIDATKPESK